MSDPLSRANAALESETPALWSLLSGMGRRAVFPPDIPFQAAQARGKAFNATIGQITDGAGSALPLPSLAAGLDGLGPADRNRALLYAPVEGILELRERWREWQRREVDPSVPSTLPVTTTGLTHGLALVADLFADEGRVLAIPTPFWGNYRQTFVLRRGARVVSAPAYRDGAWNPLSIEQSLAELPAGEPALALLNLPSNPGGYTPTAAERVELIASLERVAAVRPLLVICDDAYAGLVFADVPRGSVFWDLVGRHPNLVPVKIDGATKELSYFGGRVGFVTFGVPADSAASQALESKLKCLVRAVIGSPVSTSQVLALEALRSPNLAVEVEAVRAELARRAATLRDALAKVDRSLLQPLPFNSGCFALTELPEELGLTGEQVRQHLLAEEDTGIVSLAPRYVRLAFCSVAQPKIAELVQRVERGVRTLVGR